MNKVPPKYLAWILWAFVVGLIAVLFVVENVLVPSVRELTTAELVANMVTLTAMATVGAVVASRRPEAFGHGSTSNLAQLLPVGPH